MERALGRRLVERVGRVWMVRPRWSAIDAILAGLVVAGSLAVAGSMIGAGQVDREQQLTRLIAAIEMVESGGKADAVGDGGKAVGILQIQPVMVEDVNRILDEERFTLADRLDVGKSREMFRVYTEHYSAGRADEVKARRWNGGPRGERKAATLKYWQKVQKHLNAGGAK